MNRKIDSLEIRFYRFLALIVLQVLNWNYSVLPNPNKKKSLGYANTSPKKNKKTARMPLRKLKIDYVL